MILKYAVKDKDAGRKVYSIMRHELSVSAALTRRLKQVDGIFINGESVYTDRLVSSGDTVEIDITAAEPPCDILPESGDITILYEDSGLVAVNKPPGLITHPSRAKYTGTLANFLAGYLLETAGDGRCHAVGRLDRDTSGVVLFSKNSYMKARASEALAGEDAEKEYLALVCGAMDASTGVVDMSIKREREGNMRRITASDGQRAVTHYRTLDTAVIEGYLVSLLQLRLETGRTHQIRVHMHAAGHPILGDILYHTDESRAISERLGISSQALHARHLTFTEPVSGKRLIIEAPAPKVFSIHKANKNSTDQFLKY